MNKNVTQSLPFPLTSGSAKHGGNEAGGVGTAPQTHVCRGHRTPGDFVPRRSQGPTLGERRTSYSRTQACGGRTCAGACARGCVCTQVPPGPRGTRSPTCSRAAPPGSPALSAVPSSGSGVPGSLPASRGPLEPGGGLSSAGPRPRAPLSPPRQSSASRSGHSLDSGCAWKLVRPFFPSGKGFLGSGGKNSGAGGWVFVLASDRQRAPASGPQGGSRGSVCTFLRRLLSRKPLSGSPRGRWASRRRQASLSGTSPSWPRLSPFFTGADSRALEGGVPGCSRPSPAGLGGRLSRAGRAAGSAERSPGCLLGPTLFGASLSLQVISLTSGQKQDVITAEGRGQDGPPPAIPTLTATKAPTPAGPLDPHPSQRAEGFPGTPPLPSGLAQKRPHLLP
eukprot:bmy_09752T0